MMDEEPCKNTNSFLSYLSDNREDTTIKMNAIN